MKRYTFRFQFGMLNRLLAVQERVRQLTVLPRRDFLALRKREVAVLKRALYRAPFLHLACRERQASLGMFVL